MTQVVNSTISTIAESLGLPHLKEHAFSIIGNSAQKQILHVLASAQQIMATTKRTRLKVSDINESLESNGHEPIFGYNNGEAPELIYAGNANAMSLFVYKDRQIPLNPDMKFELAPYPNDIIYDVEWTAVTGKGKTFSKPDKEKQTEQIVPKEIIKVVNEDTPKQKEDTDMDFATTKHIISYELQLLYKKLRDILISGQPEMREKMLKNLNTVGCIQTLMPYYMAFTFYLVRNYPRNFDMLYVAISTIRSLVANQHLRFFDVYMPHFITITLTCLISNQVGPNLSSDLFIIRRYAADLLRYLFAFAFKKGYASVQPRITAQLLGVLLDGHRQISELCGALQGLLSIDLETTSRFVLPNIVKVLDSLPPKSSDDLNYSQLRMQFYSLSLSGFGSILHSDTYRLQALGMIPIHGYSRDIYREMMDTFGSEAAHYVVDDSSFLYI